MENVELESNLKSAVRKKIEEGLLTEEEGQSAYSLLSNAISQPTVKEWFNGSMGCTQKPISFSQTVKVADPTE
jgi:hypothetical protein